MAYSSLDSLFGSYLGGPDAKPPCVVTTGAANGAQAYPRARRNFTSTLASPATPYGTPLLTAAQIEAGQPWTMPNFKGDKSPVQPFVVNSGIPLSTIEYDPTIPRVAPMRLYLGGV